MDLGGERREEREEGGKEEVGGHFAREPGKLGP